MIILWDAYLYFKECKQNFNYTCNTAWGNHITENAEELFWNSFFFPIWGNTQDSRKKRINFFNHQRIWEINKLIWKRLYLLINHIKQSLTLDIGMTLWGHTKQVFALEQEFHLYYSGSRSSWLCLNASGEWEFPYLAKQSGPTNL